MPPVSPAASTAPIGRSRDRHPVSRDVNNGRNESPDLVRPVPVERELF